VSKPKVNFMSKDQVRVRLCEAFEQPVKEKRQSKHERCKDTAEKRNLSPVKIMVNKAVTLSDKQQKHHRTPRAMEPVKQIDPNSYIGLAFKCLDKKKGRTSKKKRNLSKASLDSSDNSPSDSSSDSGDSSYTSENSLDSSLTPSVLSDMSSSTSSSQSSECRRQRHGHCSRRHGCSK